MRASAEAVRELIADIGYGDEIISAEPDPEKPHLLTGWISVAAIPRLRTDARFASGIFHGLHPNVGEPRTDFRSHRHAIDGLKGSLQIVVNTDTGRFEADVDAHPAYSDVAGMLAHNFGEVIPNWFKRVFGRRP